jgi:predicted Zn-dependent peptidase
MSIEFKQATLPNGLTVIAEIVPDAHSAAMGFFVKTGARDEQPAVMGVSHFLEHMMFKGTDKRAAEVVDRDFDNIGAMHNAYTSSEITAFWAHCLPEYLPQASEILSDIMRPSLRQEDFDNEKDVILEEIAMYRDHPFWVLYEQAMEVYYGEHTLSHRVLGTPETINALTRDQMMEYFNLRYSADNTVVAMAGKLDFDAMVQCIGEHCQAWRSTGTQRQYLPTKHERNEFTIELPTVNRHYMLMMAPGPAMDDPHRYAASMLSQILGDTDGSRLYWSLVDTGLADEAQAQWDGRDGVGNSLVYCSCSPADAEKVQAIVLQEIDTIVDSINEDDLARVLSKTATAATLQGELPGGRMRRLGPLWTHVGRYRSLDEELANINAVTLADIRTVAEAFPLQPIVVGHLTPAAKS